jgi:glutamyl-Q tRNA(Asp) synthetase
MLPHDSSSAFAGCHYVGRFAPSPTGPLHFGSLLAALASYLDARANKGSWLLRIEDLDPPREDPNAVSHILATLDACHLHWDGQICYQSQRHDAYMQRLQQLQDCGLAFACTCSRKQLGDDLHLGRCKPDPQQTPAWRFLTGTGVAAFEDRLQGQRVFCLEQEIGDFVIRRRDQLWSYQLAVVTDDIEYGITHIVRGIDLIDSTPRQQLVYRALGETVPVYAHIPVAIEKNGQKLSKQNLALPLQINASRENLWLALQWLQQQPPAELYGAGTEELLAWGCLNWQPQSLAGHQAMPAPQHFLQP